MTESLFASGAHVVGRFVAGLGALRMLLIVLTLATIALAPGADTPTLYEGFGFFRTQLLPTLAPLCLAGLTFDALMSKVVMGDTDEAGRRRLRMIIRTELAVAALLVVVWAPFFMSIGQ